MGENNYSVKIRTVKVDPVMPDDYKKGLTAAKLIVKSSDLKERDVVVITSKVVSILEGRFVRVEDIKPSRYSKTIGRAFKVDPKGVELVRGEGKISFVLPIDKIVKNKEAKELLCEQNSEDVTESELEGIKEYFNSVFIVNKFGYKADSAGIDKSNLPDGYRVLLPVNPGESAKKIAKEIKELTGLEIAVIITDTLGSRPNILGSWDTPIGFYGIDPLEREWGARDIFGNSFAGGKANFVFPIAAFAGAVMGNCAECTPIAVYSGFRYNDPPINKTLMNISDISVSNRVLKHLFFLTAIETLKFHIHSFKARVVDKILAFT